MDDPSEQRNLPPNKLILVVQPVHVLWLLSTPLHKLQVTLTVCNDKFQICLALVVVKCQLY